MAKRKTTKSKTFSKETYLEWYELMLRIRKFEERANLMYFQKKIRGFLHLCIGQEAIYAGMKTATRPNDAWITAYRQHGAAMAKGITSDAAMAELFGKFTGNVKGKGGSMHFFSKEHRFYGGHGIVGGQIGLGAGIAFADKYKENDNVTFCMFGDGACRQGILHETFNMAMTWKLPVVFICENNFYAMGTSVERTSNVTDIYKLGLGYDMPSKQIDGMDVEVVHNEIAAAAEHCRSGKGPMFLEIRTYRYKGHSMSDPAKYRTKEEEKEYKEKDPVNMIEATLLKKKHATAEEVESIKAKVKAEMDAAVKFAEESEYPPVEEIYTDNYEQKDYPFIMD
ncbi:MAG: Pyruvate dehydrogenase E1 component alpha subunit (EC [uncultured Aureispira sp.]|uniref:Pyruvate dehydrogenase E1 component subunit alpha n=1 Tax=uncultured Aureispira sp. TaxID=1331704 RepID=A0A6S6UJE8_9BACT|nr:MAG: Pyruvate dehydrogenase E1 component alpha subunit (EC [uncultured Aureispira sp.]